VKAWCVGCGMRRVAPHTVTPTLVELSTRERRLRMTLGLTTEAPRSSEVRRRQHLRRRRGGDDDAAPMSRRRARFLSAALRNGVCVLGDGFNHAIGDVERRSRER
jgi:hypothetical protein